ncbi:BTAD domain-containing putative transcriptional regulator, partial [Mesorhizobium sp.]|uniref:BTAD domain-containing putative transcriptional regulator n=1 Tax=Mesorhizobium sp. TaxID=1871066 RepID=UPI0025BB5B64
MRDRLVASLPADCDEAIAHLDRWVELAPFDARAHATLLASLARRGEIAAAEKHLAAAARLFQSEDLDFAPLRSAWRTIRDEQPPRVQPACRSTAAQLAPPSDPG